jgi:hypothetical protein
MTTDDTKKTDYASVTPESGLEIDRVLVLSTSHIPKELGVAGSGVVPGGARMDDLAQMTGEYGWQIWAGNEDLVPSIGNGPDDEDAAALEVLQNVLTFARRRGCRYVRFDADADEIAALPTFEW